MSLRLIHICYAALASSLLILPLAHADDKNELEAQTILHMLDYVSVDYGATVLLGKVLNEKEFKEQVGFAEHAAKLLGGMPEHPRRAGLVMDALELAHNVQAKAAPEEVSMVAQHLRWSIIEIYHVQVAPLNAPSLTTATAIYQRECAQCHGPQGYGDGLAGKTLTPKPADFHNSARMNQRSVYSLYNTITLGVPGTAMNGYPSLSEDERWALAFFVSNLRISPERIAQGEQFWEERDFRGSFPSLVALTTLTSDRVGALHGDHTRAVFDYLRANPTSLTPSRQSTLLFASEQLDKALTEYRNGETSNARRIAIAAYLEGFEPMELSLDSLDHQLRRDIDREMLALRQQMFDNQSAERIAQKIDQTKTLLTQADELLRAGKLSVGSAFTSSIIILIREGLESMLLLAVLIAFTVKSRHRKALVYIHTGWGSAITMGMFTWAVGAWMIDISGVSREIAEGVTALITSAMLVYVGFWLHDKTHKNAWHTSVNDQEDDILKNGALWLFAIISFCAVYREIYETMLFCQALWTQTGESARHGLWGGITMGIFALIAFGWVLFNILIKLPSGPFYSVASILLAILAVIFSGQGIAALQGADLVSRNMVNFISIPMLGIFPTFQTLLAQVSTTGILILSYGLPSRRQKSITKEEPNTSHT